MKLCSLEEARIQDFKRVSTAMSKCFVKSHGEDMEVS